jgi:membrane fusion protein (multidrug efflux system)
MIKRMLIMLVLVGIVLGGVFFFKHFVDGKVAEFMTGPNSPVRQPATVATTKAVTEDWQEQVLAVGSLRAVSGADLSLEVAGVVDQLNFQSGDDVEKGKVLLKLRDQDDIGKLKALEAQADLAKITYDRDVKQLNAKAVAQSVVDNDEANLRNLKAQVDAQRALVDKKTLVAPFSGHLGLRQVDLGQYLGAGTVVVSLQALTPIYCDFLLPQQALSQLEVGQALMVKLDTFPNVNFPGKISSINSKVDSSSRNIQVRATLDNSEKKLLPGMFATVAINSGGPKKLVTVPQVAVSYNPYGSLVYVVTKGKDQAGKDNLTVKQTFVTTGSTRGDQVSIVKGINEGDEIVIGGQMKLRNGVAIAVNNEAFKPANNPNPKPVDQ